MMPEGWPTPFMYEPDLEEESWCEQDISEFDDDDGAE